VSLAARTGPSRGRSQHSLLVSVGTTFRTDTDDEEGIQLSELMLKIKALRKVGLKAEHMAFSFLKRRV
jgi:hypothetical protein